MRIFYRFQYLTTWSVCLALLLNMFSPLLTPVSGNGVIEICSVQGVKRIDRVTGKPLTSDTLKPMQQKQHNDGHCALCLLHGDHNFMLPALASDIAIQKFSSTIPRQFYHSPQTLFNWDSAQARAPPVA